MQAWLARTGIAVFAMLLAITFLAENVTAGRTLVAGASAVDLPPLRELVPAPIVIPDVVVPHGDPSVVLNDAVVLASWYGPGFFGNRTACGNVYTPELLGVAHLTLPCGTTVTLTYGSRSVTVAVIDRGPYVAGRDLDLSSATRLALGCTDLCTLRMRIGD